MVLTEEKHIQQVHCSMESTPLVRKTEEESTFGETELNNTRFNVNNTTTPTPPGAIAWPSNSSQKVARLIFNPNSNPTAPKTSIGLSAIFKVMAGDKINATAKYYYKQNATTSSNNGTGIMNNIISSIVSAISGTNSPVSGGIKEGITNPYLTNNQSLNPFITNNQNQPSTTVSPKAYINYIFFDEQFNYVPEGSYAKMVDAAGSSGVVDNQFPPLEQKAFKNGYVYVYLSNDSWNIPVYFDEFDVTHTRGAIIEDNAYYPYGLKIQGISARAAIKPITKEGYQGDYTEHDDESGYDEFELRSYDAQIGRWIQNDPKEEFASGYVGMGANPTINIDKDGGGISVGEISSIVGAIGGAIAAHFIIKNNPEMSEGAKKALKYGLPLLGAGLGYSIGESLDVRLSAGRGAGSGSNSREFDADGNKVSGVNHSANLWSNFKQFYVGLLGFTSHQKGGNLNRFNNSNSAATPDINLLGWRNNNLPDWDFWRMLGNKEPNISAFGYLWREMATGINFFHFVNPVRIALDLISYNTPSINKASIVFFPYARIPTIGWYLYWLIHKPKNKGLSPYGIGFKYYRKNG